MTEGDVGDLVNAGPLTSNNDLILSNKIKPRVNLYKVNELN